MRNAWAWLAGAAGATALAVAALVVLPRPEMLQTEDATGTPAAEPVVAPVPGPAPDPVATSDPETPVPPEIRSLRVEADGLSVISGRAGAGEEVAILLDGAELARVQAGPDGLFAAIVTLPPDPAPQMLALLADPEGAATASGAEVLIAPRAAVPEAAAPAMPAVAGEAMADSGGLPEPVPRVEQSPTPGPGEPADVPEIALEGPAPVADPEPAAPDAPVLSGIAPEPAASPLPVAREDTPAPLPDPVDERAMAQDLLPPAAPGTETAAPTAPQPGAAPAPPAATERPEPLSVTQIARAPDPDLVPGAVEVPVPLPDVPAFTPDQPATPETVPPPVLALDSRGVRVLAPPSVDAPEVIALDVIAYDPEGEVSLGGRAGQEGFVRVYLDNAAVAATTVMEGRWTVALPAEVAPGTYTLRVDEMDAAGEVVSRIESPFLRESPDSLAAAMAEGASEAGGVSVRTVQPGNSLWRIARERYGRGILYVQVFEANRDRIRNPHLIYPGQVFLLPEIGEEGAP